METPPRGRISIAAKVVPLIVGYFLFGADLIHALMLKAQKGERTFTPTRRKPFTAKQKAELYRNQQGRCMYCGRSREIDEFEIDHKQPVVREGRNDQRNLQLLCGTCNGRKSDRTDGEYRQRYRELLGPARVPRGGFQPATKEIPQQEFDELKDRTSDPQSYEKFRKERYVPPMQKILASSAVAGVVALFAWVIFMSTVGKAVIGDTRLVDGLIAYGWMVVGLGTFLGMLWRGYVIIHRTKDNR